MTCIRCGAESERVWCPTCVAKSCCSQHTTCAHRPPRNGFARSALAAAALLLAGCAPTADFQTSAAPNPPSSAPSRLRLAPEVEVTTSTRPSTPSRASRSRPAPSRAVTPPPQGRVPAVPSAEGCGPGRKTRAQSDACWVPFLSQYGWNVQVAATKLYCESRGDQHAIGIQTRYGRAMGLMQIMGYGSLDPATNIAQAWAIYSRRGWAPWEC